jgi:hypothetical protein
MRRKFFSSARALPSRKNYSPSLLAAVSGSAGASPSHFIPPSSCVLRSVLFFVPCPMSPAPLKLMRVDELWKMRYGFMGKTQIDG